MLFLKTRIQSCSKGKIISCKSNGFRQNLKLTFEVKMKKVSLCILLYYYENFSEPTNSIIPPNSFCLRSEAWIHIGNLIHVKRKFQSSIVDQSNVHEISFRPQKDLDTLFFGYNWYANDGCVLKEHFDQRCFLSRQLKINRRKKGFVPEVLTLRMCMWLTNCMYLTCHRVLTIIKPIYSYNHVYNTSFNLKFNENCKVAKHWYPVQHSIFVRIQSFFLFQSD